MDTSHSWLSTPRHVSAAFRMADAGYDVYLGNNRGNSYSRGHVHLDPSRDAKKYFDFSFAELGLHDVPAQLD